MAAQDELVFVPLGGLGEIGMNAALYGFGPAEHRRWILVDCGMGFGGEENLPGIDLVYPDLRFVEEERDNLIAIFITHAHEDHIGALVEMWPRLRAPVYATRFAVSLLETRRLSEPGAPKIDLKEIAPGRRIEVGPFSVEYVPVAHSIPESNALAIRTPHGLVVHTGDWKLDPTPYLGSLTSEADFRRLGDEGVLALIGDSTNVVRDGVSPSESDVARELAKLIRDAPHRVAITTFASNVARMRSVADAARECGREVVVVGRAMDRVVDVAKECGFLDDIAAFRPPETFGYLPRDKVVALLTGSQGEPRAALARIASDDHPEIALSKGDRVIFSSRAIPGNEKGIGIIINNLIDRGIEVITDRTHLVHVSGHPRRDEMRAMYAWTRPRIAIPAHGEALHLAEHAAFARAQGVPEVVQARNGTLVRLAPGKAAIVDDVPAGRLYRDGDIVIEEDGTIAGDPIIDSMGLPERTRRGELITDLIATVVGETLDGLPRAKRRDPDTVETAVVRAIRNTVGNVWGKKPACHVLVVEV
jgi:ribonuclease J